MGPHETPPGFGTRAIRAATRAPKVEQEPDAVPIYQAVTFSATDAADLGDILADRRRGYAYSRIDNPYAFATGMAAVPPSHLVAASAGSVAAHA